MLLRLAVAPVPIVTSCLLAGCGGTAPAVPDPIARPAEGASSSAAPPAPPLTLARAASATPVGLSGGTFSVTAASGTLTGTYTGEVIPGGGPDVATLSLVVTGGTGALAGETGVLAGQGRGAFTGEGTFRLTMSGSPGGFRAALKGAVSVGCEDGQILATLQGTGTAGPQGPVTAVLTHRVGGTTCSP